MSVRHSPRWILNPQPHSPTNYYRRRICQLRYSSLAKLYFCAISEISLIWVIFMCVLYPKATWKIIRQQLMKFEFDWVCVWDGRNFHFFFIIQLIFATIHESHCTFSYYSSVSLYYFSYLLALFTILSAKSFQFQQNKRISNRP